MREFLILGMGAWLGAASRYYLGLWVSSELGTTFPYGTFLINVTGCLLLGFLGTLALERTNLITPDLRLFVAVGFTGSYTTFSTFGFETIRLLQDRNLVLAACNVLGSVFFGLSAVYLGAVAARIVP